MGRFDDTVLHTVDECSLPLGIRTPQYEDESLALVGERTYGGIGELLPSMPLM